MVNLNEAWEKVGKQDNSKGSTWICIKKDKENMV
jgi:hypothetical protein